MALSIQLANPFEPVEILELPDNGLAVMLDNQEKKGDCKHLLDPNKRYIAKMPAATVGEVMLRSEMSREEPFNPQIQDEENDSPDLPF